MTSFKKHNWKNFFTIANDTVPENTAKPCDKDANLRMFVHYDHAGDNIIRVLNTLNMAPVYWYSDKQSTIETSIYTPIVAMLMGHSLSTIRMVI